jgi:RimJ/RimL family protein N-acetyltransferase
MIVQRTLDVGACLTILTNPEIFDLISEDGATFNDLDVDVIKNYWLSIYDKKLIGVMQIKPITSSCYEGHIHILKEYRKKHSKDAGDGIIAWCKDNLKGTLYAHTPSYCKNVINFLERFEFTNTGVIPKAWKKNGELNDLTILTRVI